jgi:hypothetical protein
LTVSVDDAVTTMRVIAAGEFEERDVTRWLMERMQPANDD